MMLIGESFVGDGAHAAHINTVLGPRNGPVGTAWASALASPSAGHVPFVAVLQPSLPVQPMTLFVTKAAPESDTHGLMIWGPAQAGVAAGVADAVADGLIAADQLTELALIAAVWVNPAAENADEIYRNNRLATRTAIANSIAGLPEIDRVLAARNQPFNPFFRPSSPEA